MLGVCPHCGKYSGNDSICWSCKGAIPPPGEIAKGVEAMVGGVYALCRLAVYGGMLYAVVRFVKWAWAG